MKTLGIVSCQTSAKFPFGESGFFKELSILGREKGIFVFVFSPRQLDVHSQKVIGYSYDPVLRKWKKSSFPLPDLIYDRCFYDGPAHFKSYQPYIKQLKMMQVPFMGYGLKGKWEVHEIIENIETLRSYVPKSVVVTKLSAILAELEQYPIILKPIAGSQGKSIYKLEFSGQGTLISGRDHNNRMFQERIPTQHLPEWLKRKIAPKRYLMQPYLNLTTNDGRAFDIRSLVQKGRDSAWSLTGMAARCGKKDSLTSNLHGGGDVYPALAFLCKQFGDEQGRTIHDQLQKLSIQICSALEEKHGRLVEVGVDFGVDRDQNIWLLEANSKPGRSVFRVIKDPIARKASVEKLVEYAGTLLRYK
jgi:glutathione synthase/RimK-type ligase-like ATP-grasp enzyme